MPVVWRAGHHEAVHVARLIVAFRDFWGYDRPSDNAFLAGVERLMDDTATDFLLGAVGEDAAPSAVAQLRYRFGIWRAGPECWLEDLFVAPEARGSGLGRALVQATLDRARERGCRMVELDCFDDNEPALALYEATGFERTRRVIHRSMLE